MTKPTYTAEDIKVLSDIEHIQKRPGMYIGETDNPYHLFVEILDNAIDECINKHCNHIVVKILADNTVEIRDYGRGVPHGKKQGHNITTLIYMKSFSSGKFDNTNYKISSGLHGVGGTVVNALCDNLEVNSYRDGKSDYSVFKDGRVIDEGTKNLKKADGTSVKFHPSKKYFKNNEVPYASIKEKIEIVISFLKGVKISLFYKNMGVEDFKFKGIKNLYTWQGPIYVEKEFNVELKSGESAQLLLTYTSDPKLYDSKGYTNLIHNSDEGSHVVMIYDFISENWGPFIKKTNLKRTDLFLGLKFLLSLNISKPEFSSQTKLKLTNSKKELKDMFFELKKQMWVWLKKNPKIREGLLKRFQDYRDKQDALSSQKNILKSIHLNTAEDGTVIRKSISSKLTECTTRSRNDSEMFIVEGDSAGGSAKKSRDVKTQAILALRGKILNVVGLSYEKALQNKEVLDIVNSMGCGLGVDDLSKVRYGKVLIFTDADPDGKNIAALLIGLFIKFFPNFVKADMLEVVIPPLYGYYQGKTFKQVFDLKDLPKGVKFRRYKGLGEMNPNEIFCSMDPSQRKTEVINFPDNKDEEDLLTRIFTTPQAKYDILKEYNIVGF